MLQSKLNHTTIHSWSHEQYIQYLNFCLKKQKVSSSYIVQYRPQNCSKRFTFYFLADLFNQTCLGFSGKIQPHCNLCTKAVHTNLHHCLQPGYSFIQLSELEQYRVKHLTRGLNCSTGYKPVHHFQ